MLPKPLHCVQHLKGSVFYAPVLMSCGLVQLCSWVDAAAAGAQLLSSSLPVQLHVLDNCDSWLHPLQGTECCALVMLPVCWSQCWLLLPAWVVKVHATAVSWYCFCLWNVLDWMCTTHQLAVRLHTSVRKPLLLFHNHSKLLGQSISQQW